MTCFWDGIMQSLDNSDFAHIDKSPTLKRSHRNFIEFMKEASRDLSGNTGDVTWQGIEFREQEMAENAEAIKVYDVGKIRGGHLTSVCDPFLVLVCQVFQVDIHHRYLNIWVKYENRKTARKVLKFRSNRGHFARMKR